MSIVEQIRIPAGSLAAQAFRRYDYTDAYRVRLPDGGPHDLDSVTRAAFGVAPKWVSLLLRLRDRIVASIGLKTISGMARHDVDRAPLRVGDRVGIFRVFQCSRDEILLGEDDWHLDFRVSILLQHDGQNSWAVVSTVVHFNNWLGRVYFLPVRPFHRLIVPAMMRNAVATRGV